MAFKADYLVDLPDFRMAPQAANARDDELLELGRLLSARMGLAPAEAELPGERLSRRMVGYSFEGVLLRAHPAVSVCLDVLPAAAGGSFAFLKASGLGLVPAALALEASARFRERFRSGGGAAELKRFAESLGEALGDLEKGRFLTGVMGSISPEGGIVLLPLGNPHVFVRRKGNGQVQRLKFPDCPALGMFASDLTGMANPYKIYRLYLKPGDWAFFLHGEFEESSIGPAIEAGCSVRGRSVLGQDLVRVIAAGLREEGNSVTGGWFGRPGNDSLVVMIKREE